MSNFTRGPGKTTRQKKDFMCRMKDGSFIRFSDFVKRCREERAARKAAEEKGGEK